MLRKRKDDSQSLQLEDIADDNPYQPCPNKRICNNIGTQSDLVLTGGFSTAHCKYDEIRSHLHHFPDRSPQSVARYFKTGKGDYAEHDKFIGLTNPVLRSLARENSNICEDVLQLLLDSEYNEERHFALFVMINQFNDGDIATRNRIFNMYMNNLNRVNNWNLVDTSAHLILGKHLADKNKDILIDLARSESLWSRRIAIMSTQYFIRMNEFEWTLKIASILIQDPHTLIHKAVGWMLREVGKKDMLYLNKFLEEHIFIIKKLTLSHAIEKMPAEVRKRWRNLSNRKEISP